MRAHECDPTCLHVVRRKMSQTQDRNKGRRLKGRTDTELEQLNIQWGEKGKWEGEDRQGEVMQTQKRENKSRKQHNTIRRTALKINPKNKMATGKEREGKKGKTRIDGRENDFKSFMQSF